VIEPEHPAENTKQHAHRDRGREPLALGREA
jgi:hypothetical protein